MNCLPKFLLIILIVSDLNFAQWTEQYYNSQVIFSSVFMIDENDGFAVGSNISQTTGVIYGTTNGGQNWFNVPGQGNKLYSVWFSTADVGFAVGSYGTIIKTTDRGGYWYSLTSGTTRPLSAIRFIDANTGWAVGGHNMDGVIILKTTNQGTSWSQNPSSEVGVLSDICFINSQVGWAVGRQQLGLPPNLTDRAIILKTTNGGQTWNSQNSGINDCQLRTVTFINENIGWAAGSKNYNSTPLVVILKTTNGGITWNSVVGNKLGAINELRMCDENSGWAVGLGDVWGNQYGLNYETTDGGNNWIHRNDLNYMYMGSLYFVNSSLGWGTATYKLYKYQTVSSVSNQFEISTDYNLLQNYPNPFNPNTKIKYSIPQSSQVQIKVFDVLGNEIETLVNEEKQSGTYELNWNAENLPSGVYFYQLKAGDFVETKKMILIK